MATNPRLYENERYQTVFTREMEHQHIHEGTSFCIQYGLTTANSNNVRTAILIKVGALEVHLIASYSCTTAANAGIYESPTIAVNTGTHTNTPVNRNRISTTASTIISNATVPLANRYTTLTEAEITGDGTFALGTQLRLEPLKTTSGVNALGGILRGTTEWILKPTLKYLFIIQNTVAAANDHNIILDWYEE